MFYVQFMHIFYKFKRAISGVWQCAASTCYLQSLWVHRRVPLPLYPPKYPRNGVSNPSIAVSCYGDHHYTMETGVGCWLGGWGDKTSSSQRWEKPCGRYGMGGKQERWPKMPKGMLLGEEKVMEVNSTLRQQDRIWYLFSTKATVAITT